MTVLVKRPRGAGSEQGDGLGTTALTVRRPVRRGAPHERKLPVLGLSSRTGPAPRGAARSGGRQVRARPLC